MTKRNSKSTSILSRALLYSLLFVAIIAAVLFLGYHGYSSSTALQPTPSEVATKPVSPSPTPTTQLYVPELGLAITVNATIADLYYKMDTSPPAPSAEFSSHSLVAASGDSCSVKLADGRYTGPLGGITLSPDPPPKQGPGLGVLIKKLGSQYLYYASPQSACSPSSTIMSQAITQQQAFLAALQTTILLK